MINKHAHDLAVAAAKYRDSFLKYRDEFCEGHAAKYAKLIKQDYEDLMSIAEMIEGDESKQSIAKAMWRLDTLVRDVIPDSVYNVYNK